MDEGQKKLVMKSDATPQTTKSACETLEKTAAIEHEPLRSQPLSRTSAWPGRRRRFSTLMSAPRMQS
jgi:hypothetical protein